MPKENCPIPPKFIGLPEKIFFYFMFSDSVSLTGGGHIVFGADPVGVSVGVTLSCLHDIS